MIKYYVYIYRESLFFQAFTGFTYNGDHSYDFKHGLSESLLIVCGISSYTNIADFFECFNNITLNEGSMVSQTKIFNYQDYTFENTTLSTWKTVNSFYFGRCITSNNIDRLKDRQFFKIYLNTSLDYKIWIHDPDIFFLSLNPKSSPKLELDYSPVTTTTDRTKNYYGSNITSVLQYLEQSKYSAKNRKQFPCKNYGKGTSFSNCLVEFINKNSSCKVTNNK